MGIATAHHQLSCVGLARQNIAVDGLVNHWGEFQPIGVNQKIEGRLPPVRGER